MKIKINGKICDNDKHGLSDSMVVLVRLKALQERERKKREREKDKEKRQASMHAGRTGIKRGMQAERERERGSF